MVGSTNEERWMQAVRRSYARMMAQFINSDMRQTLSNTASRRSYPGKVLNEKQRLMQNRESKIALQAMLAFLSASAVFVYARGNMRHVLHQCPCSIAGIMSLFAGSELCRGNSIIPEGAEFMSDKEMEKALQNYDFSLGWWNVGDERDEDLGKKRRFGIDIGKAHAS